MSTVTYALQVTLVSIDGTPIIRCWGPAFNVVDGIPSNSGWHNFIVSFDSATLRIQMAMDRGGGPIFGGGIMDTNLTTGVIDPSGAFPQLPNTPVGGTSPQQMFATLIGTSANGFDPTTGRVNSGTEWEYDADQSNNTDFAYFFGGLTQDFFDLTGVTGGIPNLNFFISPTLGPVNFGSAGQDVPLTVPLFMHTGDATFLLADAPITAWNASFEYQPNDYVSTFEPNLPTTLRTKYWIALKVPPSSGPNIGKDPLEWGKPFGLEQYADPPEPYGPYGPPPKDGGGFLDWRYAGQPIQITQDWPGTFFWKEVPRPDAPIFCYNGIFGLPGAYDIGGISTTDSP